MAPNKTLAASPVFEIKDNDIFLSGQFITNVYTPVKDEEIEK